MDGKVVVIELPTTLAAMKENHPEHICPFKVVLFSMTVIPMVICADEAYDDTSRHPYSYKYNVVDADTDNNYEVSKLNKKFQNSPHPYFRLQSLAIPR